MQIKTSASGGSRINGAMSPAATIATCRRTRAKSCCQVDPDRRDQHERDCGNRDVDQRFHAVAILVHQRDVPGDGREQEHRLVREHQANLP